MYQIFASEQMYFDGNVLGALTSRITLQTGERNFVIDVYNSRFAVMPGAGTAFYIGVF